MREIRKGFRSMLPVICSKAILSDSLYRERVKI
jgi:hypothetical protein